MPLFDYRCPKGHVTEAMVKLDRSNEPVHCQHFVKQDTDTTDLQGEFGFCGELLVRQLAAPAGSFPGASSWRK
jgi:hypothetical protein